MEKETLIVTGSSGFIGSNLTSFLQKNGLRLILPVRKCTAADSDQIIYWQISEDWNSFDKLLSEHHPVGVIHLATDFIPTHTAEKIPQMIKANIEFGTRILESAVNANIPWFINIGTFWQHFNGSDYDPVNLYAATKQAFEDIAVFYQNTYGIKFFTLCLNDTFGKGDTRKKIFAIWKQLTEHPEESLAMSPGEQLLDILYIDDVIDGIFHLMKLIKNNSPELSENKRFYLTSNALLSLRHAAETFAKVSGIPLNIEWGKRPYRQKEVMYPKCHGIPLPNWQPQISLEDGIKKFINAESDQ